MKIGKHMTAEAVGISPHEVYAIYDSHGSAIGYTEWYPVWQKYIFVPDEGPVFSDDCLMALSKFLQTNTAEASHG